MTLTIGRLQLPGSVEWRESRGEITIDADIEGDRKEVADWRHWQLLGLGQQERYVPMEVGEDPDRSGWVEVLDVSSSRILGVTKPTGRRDVNIRLRRVVAAANPRFELHCYGMSAPNDHSFSTTASWVGLPPGSIARSHGATIASRACADGPNSVGMILSNTLYSSVLTAMFPRGNYYLGGSRVEVDIDGNGTWMPAVGVDLPAIAPDRVRVSNGVVRLGWASVTGYALETWSGSEWVNVGHDSSLHADNSWYPTPDVDQTITTDPVSVSILANTPAYSTIRYIQNDDGRRLALDFTVRRWARHVDAALKATRNLYWGMAPTMPSGSTTPISGGGGHTMAPIGTSGYEPVILVPHTYAVGPTEAWRVTGSTTNVVRFGLGVVGAAGAGGNNNAAAVRNQYYAQVWATERVALP